MQRYNDYGSPTCVTRLKVTPNMADPFSIKNSDSRLRGKLENGERRGNGEHLISNERGTMKLVYGNYYSFTRLWCAEIWEIYLNLGVKIKKTKQNKTKQNKKTKTKKKKKQVNGFVYFSVGLHVTLSSP